MVIGYCPGLPILPKADFVQANQAGCRNGSWKIYQIRELIRELLDDFQFAAKNIDKHLNLRLA